MNFTILPSSSVLIHSSSCIFASILGEGRCKNRESRFYFTLIELNRALNLGSCICHISALIRAVVPKYDAGRDILRVSEEASLPRLRDIFGTASGKAELVCHNASG